MGIGCRWLEDDEMGCMGSYGIGILGSRAWEYGELEDYETGNQWIKK